MPLANAEHLHHMTTKKKKKKSKRTIRAVLIYSRGPISLARPAHQQIKPKLPISARALKGSSTTASFICFLFFLPTFQPEAIEASGRDDRLQHALSYVQSRTNETKTINYKAEHLSQVLTRERDFTAPLIRLPKMVYMYISPTISV